MNHTPFIVASYAVFAILILIDALAPLWRKRQLLAELARRYKRERAREASAENSA